MVYITYSYAHGYHISCTFIENANTLMVSICIQVLNLHGDLWMNIIFAYKTCILYSYSFKGKITFRASYSFIFYQVIMAGWQVNMPGWIVSLLKMSFKIDSLIVM